MTLYKRSYFIFVIGGTLYCLLELLWRGYTHPSMALAGGICVLLIDFIRCRFSGKSRFSRAFLCALAITATEFLFGIFLNVFLHLYVWDYSDRFLNILGQICPLYSFLWFLLSYFLIFAVEKLSSSLFRKIPHP